MNIAANIKVFQNYCEGSLSPRYIKDYVSKLSNDEYENFYSQVKEAMIYLIDEDYLIYKMYWITKYPLDDLSKYLFEELFNNIEGYDLSEIISDDNFNRLYTKYFSSLKESLLNQLDIDL